MTRAEFNQQVDSIARLMGWTVSDKRGFPDRGCTWVEFEARNDYGEVTYVTLAKEHFDLLRSWSE